MEAHGSKRPNNFQENIAFKKQRTSDSLFNWNKRKLIKFKFFSINFLLLFSF